MSNDDNNPQAGQNRPLPKKDQDTFRQVVKHYETKQYKKGLKSADSILKRFPNHGETLCMKGLIVNSMNLNNTSNSSGSGSGSGSNKDGNKDRGNNNNKRDEAIALVKRGLMNDMRSHVCWHVYGLIYRSERNYNEAIKAYKQALRIDSQNIQIYRDLSLLQIQMRDLAGFVKTRHAILELKPNQKTNWLSFALSKHLLGEFGSAIEIIDIYLDTLRDEDKSINNLSNLNTSNDDEDEDDNGEKDDNDDKDEDDNDKDDNDNDNGSKNEDGNENGTTDNNDDTAKKGKGKNKDLIINEEFKCNFESSELALYKNLLLREKVEQQYYNQNTSQSDKTSPDESQESPSESQESQESSSPSTINYEEPYNHLLSIEHLIRDKYSYLQTRAYYQLHLQKFDEAKRTYHQLFHDYGSTEDYSIHSGYMCCLLELDSDKIHSFYSLLKSENGSTSRNSNSGTGNNVGIHGARTLATILPLSSEQKDTLLKGYDTLVTEFTKSPTIQRIPLTLLDYQSDQWKAKIQSYIQRQLKRGVPSLGSDLASLFLIEKSLDSTGSTGSTTGSYYAIATDSCDVETHPIYEYISNLVDEYIDSLEQTSKFPKTTNGDESASDNAEEEPPSTLLWTWYLRAILYELAGQYSKAIDNTKKCLEQTPTAVDVYELQGRLYDLAGDINMAVSSTDEGRKLDKQDRYINNQTVKYLLRAGKEKEALDTIALFTRHESDPEQNIFDMQCYWYEMELGDCLRKRGNLGKALKKYTAIEKHFEDFNEDQFDFHSYCIRKVTLRSYLQVLRWEDTLWGHEIYAKAAEAIIGTYLNLFDNPPKKEEDENVEPDYSKMTPAERKKAKAQARKKKKKAEKRAEEEAKKAEEAAKEKKGGKGGAASPPQPKDEDPDGKKLLEMDPLEQAKKYVATLVKNAPTRLSTWLYQYDVAIRRKKYFIALQALNKAKAIESYMESGEIFTRMVEFATLDFEPHKNADLQEVFESEKLSLFKGKYTSDFVRDAATNVKEYPNRSNLAARAAVAKAMTTIDSSNVKDACDIITGQGLNLHGVTLPICVECIDYLKGLGNSDEYVKEARDKWVALVKNRYYLSPLV